MLEAAVAAAAALAESQADRPICASYIETLCDDDAAEIQPALETGGSCSLPGLPAPTILLGGQWPAFEK